MFIESSLFWFVYDIAFVWMFPKDWFWIMSDCDLVWLWGYVFTVKDVAVGCLLNCLCCWRLCLLCCFLVYYDALIGLIACCMWCAVTCLVVFIYCFSFRFDCGFDWFRFVFCWWWVFRLVNMLVPAVLGFC